jgi:hypothetical protein
MKFFKRLLVDSLGKSYLGVYRVIAMVNGIFYLIEGFFCFRIHVIVKSKINRNSK